jgi:hypothetical protein
VTFVSPLLINAMDITDRCIDGLVKFVPPRVKLLSIDRSTANILAPWIPAGGHLDAVIRSSAISKGDMQSKATSR